MSAVEFDIRFSDITLLETDGNFDEIMALFKTEPPYSDVWTMRSAATIESPLGVADFMLTLRSDRTLLIEEYSPSVGDVYYNPDLTVLNQWAQERGWLIPQPHEDLVRSNLAFWKHFWQTLTVDSSYLDDLYGIRETMRPDFGTKPSVQEAE